MAKWLTVVLPRVKKQGNKGNKQDNATDLWLPKRKSTIGQNSSVSRHHHRAISNLF